MTNREAAGLKLKTERCFFFLKRAGTPHRELNGMEEKLSDVFMMSLLASYANYQMGEKNKLASRDLRILLTEMREGV